MEQNQSDFDKRHPLDKERINSMLVGGKPVTEKEVADLLKEHGYTDVEYGEGYIGFCEPRDPYQANPQPATWAKSPESALDEAKRIVYGPRREAYGHPLDNHTRTAALWSAYLGVPVTPEQVCVLNILQKVSRNANRSDRENFVDIIGYAANADICALKKEEENAAG